MGGNQERNGRTSQENGRKDEEYFSECIERLYKLGLQLELQYKDMYEMDLNELTETIIQRKKGVAYKIWRLASFTRHPFVKNFPESPQDACPELFPPKKSIPMPDFLKEKVTKRKRGGIL